MITKLKIKFRLTVPKMIRKLGIQDSFRSLFALCALICLIFSSTCKFLLMKTVIPNNNGFILFRLADNMSKAMLKSCSMFADDAGIHNISLAILARLGNRFAFCFHQLHGLKSRSKSIRGSAKNLSNSDTTTELLPTVSAGWGKISFNKFVFFFFL